MCCSFDKRETCTNYCGFLTYPLYFGFLCLSLSSFIIGMDDEGWICRGGSAALESPPLSLYPITTDSYWVAGYAKTTGNFLVLFGFTFFFYVFALLLLICSRSCLSSNHFKDLRKVKPGMVKPAQILL